MDESVRAWVLFKLLRHRHWGGKHTSFDNLPKGKPKHMVDGIKRICKEMIKEGLLIAKPTHYGLEISLNPKEKRRIIEIISKYYKIPYELF